MKRVLYTHNTHPFQYLLRSMVGKLKVPFVSWMQYMCKYWIFNEPHVITTIPVKYTLEIDDKHGWTMIMIWCWCKRHADKNDRLCRRKPGNKWHRNYWPCRCFKQSRAVILVNILLIWWKCIPLSASCGFTMCLFLELAKTLIYVNTTRVIKACKVIINPF